MSELRPLVNCSHWLAMDPRTAQNPTKHSALINSVVYFTVGHCVPHTLHATVSYNAYAHSVMPLGFGLFPESWLLNITSVPGRSALCGEWFAGRGQGKTVPTPDGAAWAEVGSSRVWGNGGPHRVS